MEGGLALVKFLYEVLKDRPEYFLTMVLIVAYFMERGERKFQQKENAKLVDKMMEQSQDTNETLGQIRFLLEILTKGRM